jgi:hypothetical protein
MRGGDPTLAELKTQTLGGSGDADIFPPSTSTGRRISFITAAMIIFKAACAEDAYCMITSYDCGFIIALVAMLLMLALTQASHHVFVRTWSFGEAYSYQEIWKVTFGKKGGWVPALCIVIAYLICNVTGYWEIQSFVTYFVETVWPDAPEILTNRWLLQYGFLIVFVVPCIVVERISSYGWAAWLGFLATVVAVCCLAIYTFRTQFEGGVYLAADQIPLTYWDFSMDYNVLSSFNIAFFAHPMVAPVAREMERPTRSRVLAATWVANVLCGICVFLIPTFGYMSMAPIEDGENVFHYLDPVAPEAIVGAGAVIVNMICSNALFTFFMAKSVAGQILPGAENQGVPVAVAAFATSALALCVNSLGDTLLDWFYGVGSVAFSVLGFVLPPIYFFAQYRLKSVAWAVTSGIILFVGGGMMLISLVIAIQDVLAM